MKCIFRLLIITTLFSISVTAQKQLEMEPTLDKDTFLVGERIDIAVKLKNISGIAQKIRVPGTIDISVYDDNGKPVKPLREMEWAHRFGMDKKELMPGESCFKIYNISYNFGQRAFNRNSELYFIAGSYKIKVTIISLNGYTEEKLIPFVVKEPEGEELQFFKKFDEKLSSKIITAEIQIADMEKLKSLHKEYPKSVYSPRLLDLLSAGTTYGPMNDSIKGEQLRDEILENYTWSTLNRGQIHYKLTTMTSKTDRINFLKRLLPKSGNGAIKKMIEYLLNEENLK